jgi:hypothetical protein
LADSKEDALSDKMLANVDSLCLKVCEFLFQEHVFQGARREWSLRGMGSPSHRLRVKRLIGGTSTDRVLSLAALEFAEKATTLRMKKLSYHIYRLLLPEIPFLEHVAEDVTKLSRHFVGALKLWEAEKEAAKHITLELTHTIHVRTRSHVACV